MAFESLPKEDPPCPWLVIPRSQVCSIACLSGLRHAVPSARSALPVLGGRPPPCFLKTPASRFAVRDAGPGTRTHVLGRAGMSPLRRFLGDGGDGVPLARTPLPSGGSPTDTFLGDTCRTLSAAHSVTGLGRTPLRRASESKWGPPRALRSPGAVEGGSSRYRRPYGVGAGGRQRTHTGRGWPSPWGRGAGVGASSGRAMSCSECFTLRKFTNVHDHVGSVRVAV